METIINQSSQEQLLNDHNRSDMGDISDGKPQWLYNFIEVYQQLGVDDLSRLEALYDEDIVFIDPLHQVQGKAKLISYFENLYTHLVSCKFDVESSFFHQGEAAIYWQMTFQHPKLNRGNPVSVSGHSHIKGNNDRVFYHRDYLDAGAMLYEHIPFIGWLINVVKKRASK